MRKRKNGAKTQYIKLYVVGSDFGSVELSRHSGWFTPQGLTHGVGKKLCIKGFLSYFDFSL